MLSSQQLQESARSLYQYLIQRHWNGRKLIGPDPGVRLNARFGRFVKGYLDFLPWRDDYAYLQTQGYWILDSWQIYNTFGIEMAREIALGCSRYVLDSQLFVPQEAHPSEANRLLEREGYWEYPNPEWRQRIATVEGDFAAIGLIESYLRTGDASLLKGARSWWRYLVKEIGFQKDGAGLAVNYFSNHQTGMVPNNSVLTLLTLGRLSQAVGEEVTPEVRDGLIDWLGRVQLPSGEFPYEVASGQGRSRDHFLCYQYNAFQLMNLAEYYEITKDERIWPLLGPVAHYLSTGLTESSAAKYNCHHKRPEVAYYTAALAAALTQASALELGDYRELADRAYHRVLSLQRPDGGMSYYSTGNYRFLSDRRSYPRYLSMILYHLLLGARLKSAQEAK